MASPLIADLQARRLIHDSTDLDDLRRRLDDGPVTVYAGFDPTATSLHVGNLVPLLLLRRFQDAGNPPIALAGGATGMIGDPSGRSAERNLLDESTLERNLSGISAQLRRILDFEAGPTAARLVNNRTWTEPVSILDFLRDVGKYLTVNSMLARDSVKNRVASESGISYTEFSYMLLQAFDFWWLNEHEGCEVQVGGSDQWGNITAGVELIRKRTGRRAMGLTVPLVTRSDGQKFGKTAAGAVWLDADQTTPYDFFQYWMRVEDSDVERFLLQLTLLPVERVATAVAHHARHPERREGQRLLAVEMTRLVHGTAAADAAAGASSAFRVAAAGLGQADLEALEAQLPVLEVSAGQLIEGIDVVDLLAELGLTRSKGEARRKIAEAAVSINDERLDQARPVGSTDVLYGRWVMLRMGKKQRGLLVVTPAYGAR